MARSPFPVPLARVALALMPPAVLAHGIDLVVRRMERRRPRLFDNLRRLDPATVHLVPTDLPHRFALRIGGPDIGFDLLAADEPEGGDAMVKAPLQSMIDMLEGREDGDALFFARGIEVTGNTTVIVGLRNTLDREEIHLYDEILSLCGPFAGAAETAIGIADRAARKLKSRLSALHDQLHSDQAKAGGPT